MTSLKSTEPAWKRPKFEKIAWVSVEHCHVVVRPWSELIRERCSHWPVCVRGWCLAKGQFNRPEEAICTICCSQFLFIHFSSLHRFLSSHLCLIKIKVFSHHHLHILPPIKLNKLVNPSCLSWLAHGSLHAVMSCVAFLLLWYWAFPGNHQEFTLVVTAC